MCGTLPGESVEKDELGGKIMERFIYMLSRVIFLQKDWCYVHNCLLPLATSRRPRKHVLKECVSAPPLIPAPRPKIRSRRTARGCGRDHMRGLVFNEEFRQLLRQVAA